MKGKPSLVARVYRLERRFGEHRRRQTKALRQAEQRTCQRIEQTVGYRRADVQQALEEQVHLRVAIRSLEARYTELEEGRRKLVMSLLGTDDDHPPDVSVREAAKATGVKAGVIYDMIARTGIAGALVYEGSTIRIPKAALPHIRRGTAWPWIHRASKRKSSRTNARKC